MSRVARVVGAVASVVSIAMMFVPGGQIVAGIATASRIGSIAAGVAAASGIAAGLLQKKPPAQGSVTEVRIGPNLLTPCAIGNRTYCGGNRMHDAGYGAPDGKVKNPYRSMVDVWSLGPVQSIVALQADFTTISFTGDAASGYYNGFLWKSTQLGALPEAAALAGPHGAIPNWGASSKLSGLAAGLWTAKFDKKGKVYASGLPQFGAILAGVYVYDQRQDSTYPGGSGAARAKQESTYVGGAAADNPSCNGVTYALGRYQNGKKVFGCGFEADAIDWPAWTAFANHCDANGWKSRGIIFEPGSRWDNLKRICEAGGGEPVFVGALLSVRFDSPKVSLDTITSDDLADEELTIPGMRSYRDRKNIIVPRYRSEAHKWEYVQATEVAVTEYITADGEEKPDEVQFDLVQEATQATQLAAYKLVNAREITPIVLNCKPRMMVYRLGEAVTVDLPDEGLDNVLCEIIGRSIDPGTASVTLTLRTETNAKHAFALGLTGTAPPTPALSTGEDLDEIVASVSDQGPLAAADEPTMLALQVTPGTSVVRSDNNQTYEYNGGTTGTAADWTLVGVTTGATAATTSFTPAGDVVATTVQAAIVELDTEKAPLFSPPLTGTPTAPTAAAGSNTTQIATTAYVRTAVTDLVASSPATLDTLDELAAALGDDPNFATTTATALGNRLRVDTNAQVLTATQKGNARTNLSMGTADSVTFTGIIDVGLFKPQAGIVSSGGPAIRLENTGATIPAGATGLGMEMFNTSGISYLQSYDRTALAYGPQRFRAASYEFQIGTTARFSISGTGFDIVGEARCDTLRIDATATAAAVAQTHHVPISINGTTYKLLLAS